MSVTERGDGCMAGAPHGMSSESHSLGGHIAIWRPLKKQNAE